MTNLPDGEWFLFQRNREEIHEDLLNSNLQIVFIANKELLKK